MKPGKTKKDPHFQIDKNENVKEADGFVKLMKNIGVTQLDPPEVSKPPTSSESDQTEPINFENVTDWLQETADLSSSGKFSGLKRPVRRKPDRKLKITRTFKPDDILDLHGETRDDALSRVQNAIRISEKGNYRTLLIITGKGMNSKKREGVLRKAVWGWLEHHKIDHPIRFQWAPPFLGGKGAILVFF
jgi:DNA-nicking Smr family endonuclease